MPKPSRPNVVSRYLGSVHLMAFLILAFAIASGVATFIEAAQGTPAARALVYEALWFEILIGLIIVNLTVLLFNRMPYRRSQLGFVMVHLSIIVILISSGITRFFGYEGSMHIREGDSASSILSLDDYLLLNTAESEEGFEVSPWKAGPTRIAGKIDIEGESYRLAIKEFYPHFARRLAEDAEGPATLSFAVTGEGGGMQRMNLSAGASKQVGDVQLRFHEAGMPAGGSSSEIGELVARLGGEERHVPVALGATTELGGVTLRIEEFHADYSKRNSEPAATDMNNPMIRVLATGPEGEESSQILFALFPDFSMKPSGDDDPFPELELSYEYGRSVEFAVEAGNLVARASFSLDQFDMASGQPDSTFASGESFRPVLRTLLRSGDFSIVPTEFWEHASLQAVHSNNPDAPAAARIEMTGADGHSEEYILRRGEHRDIRFGDKRLGLRFGSRRIDVPYRIHLDDFQLLTYPGSNNPASYESHVRLYDEAAGIDGRPVRVYMNHPLTYKGYKHFQSSYDQDHLGTVFSVNHDPGKWPTYIGYIMIGLGFLLILFKGPLVRSEIRSARKKVSA